jgi:hypothetical protein
MKTWAGIAVACVFLSACATDKPSNAAMASATAGPATYYCWRDRLMTSAESHTCNWERTAREACESTNFTPLAASSVTSKPAGAGRCDNGQWLVKVETR